MNRKIAIFAVVVSLSCMFLAGCSSSNSNNNHLTTSPIIAITMTSGSGQSATVSTAFASPLVATVTTNGSPTSGVTVTFTAPASGASGTFSGGQATETQTTNSSGVATSSTFTANATAGAYTISASTSGATASATFNMTNAAVVTTTYVFDLSGLEAVNGGSNYYALAGAVTLDPSGNVIGGEQDYNDAIGLTSPEPSGDLITGGSLTTDANGQGTLTLITNNTSLGVSGTETLGIQFVNPNHAMVIHFDGTGSANGSLDLQTASSTLSGPYAFAMSGVDTGYSPFGAGGIFSITGTAISGGLVDVNDNGTVGLGNAFTGTLSAADSFGRGTITGTGLATNLNYYIVNQSAVRVIVVDTDSASLGSAFSQGTNGSSASNASLGSSVFGLESNSHSLLYSTAGMFATDSTGGTFTGVGDIDEEGNVISGSAISGTYSIASNGYGSLTVSNAGLQDVTGFGIYMTDPNLNLNDPNNTTGGGGALVVDMTPVLSGGVGIITPQTDTTTANFTGNYAFGGQDFNIAGEFDYVGNGPVSSSVLTGSGLIADPFGLFATPGANYTAVPFTATMTPDASNVGRYTTPSLEMTPVSGSPIDFQVAIYQASGNLLYWVDEDNFSLSLGSLQTLSLPAKHAAAKAPVKKVVNHKH